MQPPKQKRLTELDALRGIAALSVVLFHFTFAYQASDLRPPSPGFVFPYGHYGVHLFFLISGYVIFMSVHKSTAYEFVVSRFSRLYPVYWVCLSLTALVIFFVPAPFPFSFTTKELLVNYTMFQQKLRVRDLEGTYWTLSVELSFYFLILGLIITRQKQHITAICAAWLVVCVAFITLPDFAGKKILNNIFIISYAPLFIAGINFYLLKNGNRFNHLLILLSFVVESVFILKKLVSSSIVLAFYLTFYAVVYEKAGILKNSFLLFLGRISYAVYLLHSSIGFIIIYHLRSHGFGEILYLPITIGAILGIAALFTFYIEKPVQKKLRRLLLRNEGGQEKKKNKA